MAAKKKAAKKPVTKLTAKRLRFIEEYLIDCDATKAAKRAGFSEKTAHQTGYELLRVPEVAEKIAERQKYISGLADVSTVEVVRQLARMAFFNPKDMFDEDGDPLPIHKLPDDAALVIQGFKTRKEAGGDPATITEYKMSDRNSAADKLMKHLGGYEKDNSQQSLANASTQDIQAALAQKITQLSAQGLDVSKLIGK